MTRPLVPSGINIIEARAVPSERRAELDRRRTVSDASAHNPRETWCGHFRGRRRERILVSCRQRMGVSSSTPERHCSELVCFKLRCATRSLPPASRSVAPQSRRLRAGMTVASTPAHPAYSLETPRSNSAGKTARPDC